MERKCEVWTIYIPRTRKVGNPDSLTYVVLPTPKQREYFKSDTVQDFENFSALWINSLSQCGIIHVKSPFLQCFVYFFGDRGEISRAENLPESHESLHELNLIKMHLKICFR